MRGRRFLSTSIVAAALLALIAVPTTAGALSLKPANLVWKKIAQPAVPAWATPELHAKALAAGPQGVALPAGAEVPASSLAFLGIRPGQLMLLWTPDGSTVSICTSNFIFGGGGQQYIGTAGHCGAVGDTVDMLVLPNLLVTVGKIVMSTGDAGIGNDFAMASIDPALNGMVSPSMAVVGGPTGVYTGSGPALIAHTGWGIGIGTGGTPRVGLGMVWTPNEWLFNSIINKGDSGSGANVLPGSLAAGNITHIAPLYDGYLTLAAGTSIQKILQLAGVPLRTCGSPIPWPLPGCPG